MKRVNNIRSYINQKRRQHDSESPAIISLYPTACKHSRGYQAAYITHDMHHTAALQKNAALTKNRYIALRFQKKHCVGYIPL